MASNQPLVSFGVPVYNDAQRLRNSLDHLLNQDYPDLEIILADDGSTDGSREICRAYAERDARVRYFENKHNLGALANHKFVFDVSTGDYFAWGSGHDYYGPSFVSRLLESLQSNPAAVLACSQSVFEGESGEVLRTTKGGLDTRGLPPVKRFERLLEHLVGGGTANIFYGLYRQEALAQVSFPRTLGWDVIMLGALSLLGEITQVNEVLYYRLVTDTENSKERTARHARVLLNTHGSTLEKRLMPYFSASCEFLNIAENSRLSACEKQDVYELIIALDVQISEKTLTAEIAHFLAHAKAQLLALQAYPEMRRYLAMKTLSVIEQAYSLGLQAEGSQELTAIASSALDLEAGAAGAVQEQDQLNQPDASAQPSG